MTVFEAWVKSTVSALVRDMRDQTDPGNWLELVTDDATNAEHKARWDAMEMRLAIGLVQARALECRQISGSVMVKHPKDLQELAQGLMSRSSQLENLGKDMATSWPFAEEQLGPRLVQ